MEYEIRKAKGNGDPSDFYRYHTEKLKGNDILTKESYKVEIKVDNMSNPFNDTYHSCIEIKEINEDNSEGKTVFTYSFYMPDNEKSNGRFVEDEGLYNDRELNRQKDAIISKSSLEKLLENKNITPYLKERKTEGNTNNIVYDLYSNVNYINLIYTCDDYLEDIIFYLDYLGEDLDGFGNISVIEFLDFYDHPLNPHIEKYLNEKYPYEVFILDAVDILRNVTPRRDPLVIDLDNDGIETTGLETIVNFDHDNDGIKEQTGWISPDDGLLVLDKNNNGNIDNGSELFGDNTPLEFDEFGNPTILAKNGFEALSQYDLNNDGKIDNSDDIYDNLMVWQDFNSDGISQTNELKNLN